MDAEDYKNLFLIFVKFRKQKMGTNCALKAWKKKENKKLSLNRFKTAAHNHKY